MMRKAINQFPYGEAHMHIFMNGTDYKKAVADQKNGVCDRVIHAHLAEYRKRGITWLREGGDIYGTSKRTMELAPMGSPIGRRYLPFIKKGTTEASWEEVMTPCRNTAN